MAAEPDYLTEADRLRAAARRAAVKYGPFSQAVVFLKYEELVRLRHAELTMDPRPTLAGRIAEVGEALREAYSRELAVRHDHPTRVINEDPLVIQFDRKVFDERYAGAARTAVEQIWKVGAAELPEGIVSGAPHMFVIDDEDRLLIWRRRFTFRELIFGRAKSKVVGVPVAHPMLVPDRLRVRAAGEIVLIGAPRVFAIVANTKSGHFRPPPSTGAVVRRVCERLFDVPAERIDVFTVGGLSDVEYSGFTHRLAGATS
ncbi:hypothetical protein [Micromonospora schwarzwaldensis]|uniref:hypothetical protein n=1 Tax=Micromonospora sp. DSM 45708 TaxID=3111767 RepID=UPI0031D0A086